MQHLKRRLVEGDDIVPEDEGGPLGYCIQSRDEVLCLSGKSGSRIGIRPESTNFAQDRLILAGGLDVDA
jgi:hypothetical protein